MQTKPSFNPFNSITPNKIADNFSTNLFYQGHYLPPALRHNISRGHSLAFSMK
jgi:hypothetical protein